VYSLKAGRERGKEGGRKGVREEETGIFTNLEKVISTRFPEFMFYQLLSYLYSFI
jgi:hypothetical protein